MPALGLEEKPRLGKKPLYMAADKRILRFLDEPVSGRICALDGATAKAIASYSRQRRRAGVLSFMNNAAAGY